MRCGGHLDVRCRNDSVVAAAEETTGLQQTRGGVDKTKGTVAIHHIEKYFTHWMGDWREIYGKVFNNSTF